MVTAGKHNRPVPEIWGGIECTINRVGNRYMDQLELANYYNNPGYLDAIIGLGIKTIRFPVLWERHQPVENAAIDWTWATGQLNKLNQNDISVIAGLLHHGSGPVHTGLLQKDFPEKFASYAAEVARQFPWINYYTPINEPLTTARFSGLYGFWYPHKKNDVSFIRILLNELKGTVLAMQEIRKINPAARLVQTEDLGKTYSSPLLAYQADFENQRRWLTLDILTGNFNEAHLLWNYFMRLGIDKQLLQFFEDNPCPPDIIGANYYLTSERYLDDDIQNHPPHTHGGNTIHHYADVEAVRIDLKEPHGPEILLQELWQRYKIPLAITEVHLHCSREEQVRWLQHMYDVALKLKDSIDIRAVTAWSLLGSFGWNKLLTDTNCDYETGAFDISAGYARPTALAALIKKLPVSEKTSSHFLPQDGWWKQDSRFYNTQTKNTMTTSMQSRHPLIIIGKTGVLGRAFAAACRQRNINHVLLGRNDVDICNSASIEKMIKDYDPWCIINAAGYLNVDTAEREKDECYKINTLGPQKLGILSELHHIKLVCFSSDLVFDGTKDAAYVESDACNALNIYGSSKVFAENFLANVNPSSLVVRTSAFFTAWDNNTSFVSRVIQHLQNNMPITIFEDNIVSPTYVPHLVNASLDLLMDDCNGIWHLANKGGLSWYRFAQDVAAHAGLDESLLVPVSANDSPAKRPPYSVLASEKYNLMPSLEEGLQQYFIQHEALVLNNA